MTITEIQRNAAKQIPADKLKFDSPMQAMAYTTVCAIYLSFYRDGLTKTEAKQMKDEVLLNLHQNETKHDFNEPELSQLKTAVAHRTPVTYGDVTYDYISGGIVRYVDGKWQYFVEMMDRHKNSVTIVPLEKCIILEEAVK